MVTSSAVLDGIVTIEALLTWISGEFEDCRAGGWVSAQSGCRKAAVAVWGDVLAFSDMAGALEDPQENRDGSRVREKHLQSDLLQDELLGELDGREREELIAWISATEPQSPDVSSSPAPPCFIAQLPDFPQHSRELNEEARAATRTPSDPFWGPPPSLGQLQVPPTRELRLQQCSTEQDNLLLCLDGRAGPDSPRALRPFGFQGTLLTHVQLASDQNPQIPFLSVICVYCS